MDSFKNMLNDCIINHELIIYSMRIQDKEGNIITLITNNIVPDYYKFNDHELYIKAEENEFACVYDLIEYNEEDDIYIITAGENKIYVTKE